LIKLLNGARVLVTRPAHQAQNLSQLIEERGGVAIRFPTLAIVAVDNASTIRDTLAHLERYQWFIFISANAVTMHGYYSDGVKMPQFKLGRIAAIGKATAQALAHAGLPASLVPEGVYNSEALLAMPQMQQMKGQNCLIIRGEGGREELATTLRSRGAAVEYLDVYKRVIPGIDSSQVRWNNEGSFLNDAHKDLKADYIIANPPFNVSDWSGELLRTDGRWQYGTPPAGNANFAWLQHFAYHLAPTGQAGIVLAKGALTSKTSGEGDIRKALIEDGNLIDCIVNLPAKLFLNTQIPAALWFMSRGRDAINRVSTDRSGKILFIDARNLGHLINRRTRELSEDDIQQIAGTYHNWRNPDGNYEDVKGFCCSAPNRTGQKTGLCADTWALCRLAR